MSAQKRKATTPEPTSLDTTGEDPPRIPDITACVTIKKQMEYDVIYTVAFTKACCEFHKKIMLLNTSRALDRLNIFRRSLVIEVDHQSVHMCILLGHRVMAKGCLMEWAEPSKIKCNH
jgi:hypothetical protein